MYRTPERESVPRYADRLVEVVRAMVRGIQSDRITFLAASLAYYAFVSLIPLLLLALVATQTFGGPNVAASVVAEVERTLGPEVAVLVRGALANNAGRGSATVVGIVVLLWSGLKLFRGLDVAFDEVYDTPGAGTFLDQVRDGLVALAAVGVGIVATGAVGVLSSYVDLPVLGRVGELLLADAANVLSLALAFFPLYLILPDADVTAREVLPGTLLAAFGWTILQTVFGLYAANAGSYAAYGVLGAVLLLVTFLYFGALILLLGVVLNAILAGRVDFDTDLDTHLTAAATPDTHDTPATYEPTMGDADTDTDANDDLREEIRQLREEVTAFEDHVDERTVPREEVERDLKRYVRQRVRRGKARGWGPYLVLLYGTAMTIGGFYYLSGGWAVLAMVVIWLSTLGLYVLMLLVGVTFNAAGIPGKVYDRVSRLRE
jgi:membrane protein